jgi:hypothetical protein
MLADLYQQKHSSLGRHVFDPVDEDDPKLLRQSFSSTISGESGSGLSSPTVDSPTVSSDGHALRDTRAAKLAHLLGVTRGTVLTNIIDAIETDCKGASAS